VAHEAFATEKDLARSLLRRNEDTAAVVGVQRGDLQKVKGFLPVEKTWLQLPAAADVRAGLHFACRHGCSSSLDWMLSGFLGLTTAGVTVDLGGADTVAKKACARLSR